MTKSKKIIIALAIALACLSVLLTVIPVIAVFSVDNGPQMYDISIKITYCIRKPGEQWLEGQSLEWIFTPDNDEIHIKHERDRFEYCYYVSGYSFPNHPYRRGKWYTPDSSGSNYFNQNLIDQTNNKENLTSIHEMGEYVLCVTTNTDPNLWNDRTVRFYIEIT